MKLSKWEQLLCVLLPFCTALDPFFTFHFSNGKGHIIANEMNPLLVWAVVQDIPAIFILVFTFIVIFILSLISINILKKQKNAYILWTSAMVVLCFLRPLAGLTWYFNTVEYTSLIITALQACGILMLIAIGAYIVEKSIHIWGINNGTARQ